MLTRWGRALDREHPLPEYPRPQLVRDAWVNLNGVWEHAFTDSPDREANRKALIVLLEELFAEKTLAEWETILSTQDGQWDVLLPAGQVQHDAQAVANGYVQRVEHEGDGKIVLVPAPAQFDGVAPTLGRAPTFGADTDDVLRSHGFDDDAVADLRARGIIR